nr:putative ribonuclease H-like domain-containing protein [Tanacetum cinerariifolium]
MSLEIEGVTYVTKPLHTLHMDLFGPTFVSSLSHKWYCLVLPDDFSSFSWTFFLKTKDETSGILRNFITEIENLKELKVKIIRCDNGGEFRNKEMNDFCLSKGIKREFSNARTPDQNEVAEKRNRTLIEAARTMLADAKLPVTFWAEAVKTACYVQNRVLVNKSQNKTPYELFNGRSPTIGFLKPFGCHVMILNTLDNLEKFKAKGDEGYFNGYSMSSKAFRVFNKRTKRVEENLHVDFLENKPIEKGAGPNWFFDIDSLTNSMNYVPVVVGTISTNFSAHLEFSKSNAQDACSADVPESSGNFNPTASTTNPLADHMDTLAVETPIPTISSHVPTACLDVSPESLSDTKLVSKRVTNQDNTPSLDNILTLTNRFENIIGVTTNSDESNGVDADLSNMENNISASPTPTLRIHKDHLKSQIINPVDTPVQTRTKSKEMEEQSFIATIYQKTNPALL